MMPVRPPTGTATATVAPRSTNSLRARFGYARWLEMLSASDASTRADAVRALANYAPRGGDSAAISEQIVQQIAERLRSEPDPAVQQAMVDALFELSPDRAAGALLPLVSARAALTPIAAQRALVRMGPSLDRDAIDVLCAGLAGTTFNATDALRGAALDALASAPDEPFADRVAAYSADFARLAIVLDVIGRRGDGRWGSAVLEQLSSPQRIVQIAATRAAARLRLLESASLLVRIIREHPTDIELQIASLRALAVVGAGDPEATRDVLRAALGTAPVAAEARRAIAALGVRALVPELARGLESSWRVDRRAIAETLGDVGGIDAARALFSALERERDALERRVLYRAAARADEQATRRALEAAGEGDVAARWTAIELWVRSGALPRMHSAHAAAMRGEIAAMAIECISGETSAARAALASEDAEKRFDGAWALTFAKEPPLAALLTAFERERETSARIVMAIALARSDSSRVTAALETAALRSIETVTYEQGVLAELLGRRGSNAARALIAPMLEDRRPWMRAVSLWLAARTSDPRGLAVARRLSLVDPSEDVRRVADAAARTQRERPANWLGSSVLSVAGATARTPWLLWLPSGQIAVAVSASDGTILVPGVPSGAFELESIE